MVSRSAYFREYNQRPKRKKYLGQKAKERNRLVKKENLGIVNFSCPNCSTTCGVQLTTKILKNN